jgi:TPP-dependent indolepyruvate ferredoxin oxidoreductase alpha subunit
LVFVTPVLDLEQETGRCLFDLGVGIVTWVPALGVSGCAEGYAACSGGPVPPSFHEEVAFGCAHGAGLAGTRSAAVMKTHGLLKAANAVSDALFCGTNAAVVLVVVDDTTGIQSDSIIEAGPVLDALELPWVRSNPANVRHDLRGVVATSEQLGLPAALVIDAADASVPASSTVLEPLPPPPKYRRDPSRNLLVPSQIRQQRGVLSARLHAASPPRPPPLPRVPDDVPDRWRPAVERYGPLFRALTACRPSFVAGDIGISSWYGFPPFDAIDAVTYMGGAVPLAIGAHLAGCNDAWAVSGDFSFVAAGHLGLLEAVSRAVPLRVLILANGQAETTGGQPVACALLDRVLAGYTDAIVPIEDPCDERSCAKALAEAGARDGVTIVIAQYGQS